MKKVPVPFSGFCPVHKQNCSIYINYIDASTYEGPEYSKGTIESCPYRKNGNSCNVQCPIFNKAPKTVKHELN